MVSMQISVFSPVLQEQSLINSANMISFLFQFVTQLLSKDSSKLWFI
jgi:hypothetical protein